MNEIIFSKLLNSNEKIILIFLNMFKSKRIKFSLRDLEKILFVSHQTISNCIKSLHQKKYLTILNISKGIQGLFLIELKDIIDLKNVNVSPLCKVEKTQKSLTPLQKHHLNPNLHPHPLGQIFSDKNKNNRKEKCLN